MKMIYFSHTILFAVYPVLFLYSHNVNQTSFSQTFLPVTVILFFTILLLILSKLVFKDSKKAGIIVSVALILFFSYGHVFEVIQKMPLIGRHRYLMLFWCGLFILTFFSIKRTKNDLVNFSSILNVISFLLVLITLFDVASYKYNAGNLMNNIEIIETAAIEQESNTTENKLPDIYYIILDGYASTKTLKEFWDYDNHDLTSFLKEKHFYLASESHSNYLLTHFSLASSLNMEYINYLSGVLGPESKDENMTYNLIENSKTLQFLKSKGYKFINFNSGWGGTLNNKHADLNVPCGRLNNFTKILIKTTMLDNFMSYIYPVNHDRREKVLCAFSTLPEVQDMIEGPRFVFAHIVSPHPPWIFNSRGEPTYNESNVTRWIISEEDKQSYLNQLRFINKKVKSLVKTLLSKSEELPIIIIQGDHGPDSDTMFKNDEEKYNVRSGILNVYFLPDKGDKFLYKSMSPVNTFRLIFNIYFNSNYELLDDKTFYSSYKEPYRFIDITNNIN